MNERQKKTVRTMSCQIESINNDTEYNIDNEIEIAK
jgi:hypothetical protein